MITWFLTQKLCNIQKNSPCLNCRWCDYYLVQEEEEMLSLLDSEVIIIALRPMEYSTTVLRKVSELSSPMHVDCSLDKKCNI